VVVRHPAVLDELKEAAASCRCRNREWKKETDCRGVSDPIGRRRHEKPGDDRGNAIRSEPREAANNVVVRLRWKCNLRDKRQDPWRKANDR